jgi:type II secretory pathway pseudopilin PulG
MSRRAQKGFTYLGLLIFIAILGLISGATLHLGAMMQRREAEQDLLERGLIMSRALESYARNAGGSRSTAPASIDELLHDPRFPKSTVRHLRRIEIDPITGRPEWGLVRGPDGKSIIAIHSLSEEHPLKIGDFPKPFEDFEGKGSYREWVFTPGMED